MRTSSARTMIGALLLGCGGGPSMSAGEATSATSTAATGSTAGETDVASSQGATGETSATSDGTTGESDGPTGASAATTGTEESTSTGESAGTTGEPTCEGPVDGLVTPVASALSEDMPTLFPRPDGYHLIYRVYTDAFETHLVKLDLAGEVVTAPKLIATPDHWLGIASGDERYAASTGSYVSGVPAKIVVAEIGADEEITTIGAAPIPLDGAAHWTSAVAWNPSRGEWGVLVEEVYIIDPMEPGVYHSRLHFGRVTADGAWISGSKVPLTSASTEHYAFLSEWSPPLVWAGDRYAAAWSESDSLTDSLFLVELSEDGEATRTSIAPDAARRGVPAWDGAGYGVAWQRYEGDHNVLRFAYVHDGAVGDIIPLGDDALDNESPSIVAVDGRFAVTWTSGGNTESALRLALIDPEDQSVEERLLQASEGTHNWGWRLVHDGCRYAAPWMRGDASKDIWVRIFE